MGNSLQRCRAFVTIAELRNFGDSAKAMGVSQPGISRMISDLEAEWGFKLFDRNRNGVSLTNEGAHVLSAARRLCADDDALNEKVKSIHNVEAGHITVGVFTSVSTHWIPNIIKKFSEDHPDIKYDIFLGNYTELREWVSEGRVDFAFMSASAAGDAEVIPIEEDELMAVIPTDNPYAEHDVFPIEALGEFPFMLLKADEDTNIDRLLRREGVDPDVRLQTWDDYSIMSMVDKGLGISVLPAINLKKIPYNICIKHLERPAFRTICIGKKRGKELSVAAKEFLNYLKYRTGSP